MECLQIKGAEKLAEIIESLMYAGAAFQVEYLGDEVWEVAVPLEYAQGLEYQG